ncbi:type IV pilus biogenesis/stability protein PilW [Seminibacterium arietis]|uniref:Type IV pilus biogenesis/stability protein PilW n=1 Tax=Seminibacterium arietis TaxID=1173502 RepID=A0ABW3I730_9PAST
MKMMRFNLLISLSLSIFLFGCVSSKDSSLFDRKLAAKARVELSLGYLSLGDTAQAKLNLDRALSYAPNYYLVHGALAYFYQLQGDNEKAQKSYQQAIKLDNQQGDLFNNYGAFLCSQRQFKLAYQQFQTALSIATYYHQADTYENIMLCALSENNSPLYQKYYYLLEKIAPERAKKYKKL